MGKPVGPGRSREFRPAVIEFDEILDVFFAIHFSPKVSRFCKLFAAKRKAS
jgi:hypothetical protein